MNNLEESIKKVFESTDIKNLINKKVEELSDKKSKEIVENYIKVIDEETNKYIDSKEKEFSDKKEQEVQEITEELHKEKTKEVDTVKEINERKTAEIVENYIKTIDKESAHYITERVNELSEKKTQEMVEEYIKVIDEETNKYIDEKLESVVNKVSSVLKNVVENFVREHEEDFKECKNRIQSEAILESLTTVCKVAGVNAKMIANEVNHVTSRSERVLESRIEVLKAQLQEQINANKTNTAKIQMLNDKLEDKECEKDDEIKSLKEEISKINADKALIIKEKNDVIRMGIISEMKRDMSLIEADTFEKNAKNIPFSLDKKYIKKLETLKESILSENKEDEKSEVESNINNNVSESYYRYV